MAEDSSSQWWGEPYPGTPGARVGTVYSAKRVIECKMVARLHSIIICMIHFFSLTLIKERKKDPLKKVS
jgi:hypothetical protein